MPNEQRGQVSDWNSITYPGILEATPTAPIPLDSQIAALINGGGLSGADTLARMSDLPNAIMRATKNEVVPIGATKKLITTADIREQTVLPINFLNGFEGVQGYSQMTIGETLIAITIVCTTPANTVQGTKICDLPYPVNRSDMAYSIVGSPQSSIYSLGAALYSTGSAVISQINNSMVLMRQL